MQLDMPAKPVKWLIDNIAVKNIAADLNENTLQAIGADVVAMYEYDKASREEWEKKIEQGIKVAKQIVEEKSYPFQGAANTKDSLMAEAAAQFAARAGGEVVRGQDVVKVKVTGADPEEQKQKRAKRVSDYMSYECTDGMDEWESENDQLLTSVSLIGMYYKKTFRDPIKGRNVSYARSPMHVVVNEDAKTLQGTRITEEMNFNSNAVQERIRSGLWLDIADKMEQDEYASDEMFLEQHRTLDLDGDGYEEPYVVTVHKDSQAVCRIVACYEESGIVSDKGKITRIERVEYFTEFPFLLSPDGKFHKIGWAHLLGPNTEVVNTIVNQLLDAGHMANCPPIFMGKGAKLPAGGLRVAPGRVIPIESTGQAVKDNIVVMPMTGPSDVLFKLLGLLTDKGQKLANLSDSMQGETGGANVPATTTLALLDQALKVYTSILKRLFRAYKKEFQKLYKLDSEYLTDGEYVNVIDISDEDLQAMGVDKAQVTKETRFLVEKDFSEIDKDIQPVMDPTASSEALRLARLNAMAQAAQMPPAIGRIYLEGIGCDKKDIDAIFPPPEMGPDGKPVPPPTPPEMIKLQADIMAQKQAAEQKDRELDQKHAEIEQKEAKLIKELEMMDVQIVQIKSASILNLANAEKAEIGTQIGIYKGEMDQLNADRDHELAVISQQTAAQESKEGTNDGDNAGSDAGTTQPMAQPTDNQEGAGVLPQEGSGGNGGLPAGQLPDLGAIAGGDSGMGDGAGGSVPGVQPHADTTQLPPAGPMQ